MPLHVLLVLFLQLLVFVCVPPSVLFFCSCSCYPPLPPSVVVLVVVIAIVFGPSC